MQKKLSTTHLHSVPAHIYYISQEFVLLLVSILLLEGVLFLIPKVVFLGNILRSTLKEQMIDQCLATECLVLLAIILPVRLRHD